MRLTKTVQLGDRQVTVYELRAKDIRHLLALGEDLENMGMDTAIETVLPMICDLGPKEFDELGMSSMLTLWDAAREVNAAFFDLARRAGLTETAKQVAAELTADLKAWIDQGLKDASAGLSAGDTQTPQTTDGASL